jgi:FHA domain
MRGILGLAGIAIVADQAQPFYKNPYILAGAALVVALIILIAALLLFRSSGKKKRANAVASAAGPSDWQRQGQQGMPGGWNQPATGTPANNPWGQQPNAWAAQQQPGPGGWGAQNPAQQQPGAWGAQSPAQQQQAAWGTPAPAQQPGGWGNQGAGATGGQQPWDAAPSPSPVDPWAQQQAAAPWGTPSPQSNQPAPPAYGSSGSDQSWGQPAQVADQWGQPVQQPAQQAGWPSGYQQSATSTPPGANAPWQQQGQGFAEADRTMLRPSPGPQGIGLVRIEEGKEPGRIYEVRKEALSIGRSRESDIFLEDLAVSRLHASILNLGNNNYALRDEGSANGTKVNGQPVNKYQPYPLQEGDKIQLGQTVLVFAKR